MESEFLDRLFSRKDKNVLHYVKMKGGILTQTKVKKIPVNVSLVGPKNNRMKFDSTKPAYRSRNKFHYFVDLQEGQIDFDHTKKQFSPKLWDQIMNQHIVKDLVSGLKNAEFKQMVFYIIIGILTALPFGYILGNFLPFK